MTATNTDLAAAAQALGEQPEPVEVVADVTPEPDSRLEQLLAQYDMAYAESKKAADALDAIKAGIKTELTKAAPEGVTAINVASPMLSRPLRLVAVTSWRVDAQKLKVEEPLTYVRFAKQSTAWTLKQVGSAIG